MIIIRVNQTFDIKPIHKVEISNIIQGEYLFFRFIFFKDIVGILLTIKKPIQPRLTKLR